jgi:hypothetical protein
MKAVVAYFMLPQFNCGKNTHFMKVQLDNSFIYKRTVPN